MKHRTATLAAGLLAGIAIAVGVDGCVVCSGDPRNESEPIDLGIDSDLNDVVRLGIWYDERHYEYLAVGASGTVVAWGFDYGPKHADLIVDVFDLGDLDLRAAWIDNTGNSWWVVGDGALLMVSHNRGATWETVELQTSADLHGLTGFTGGRPIVVGDDIVAMRTVDGTWTELVPPAEGWGQLRGVSTWGERVIVIGLDGVIWSTLDPSGAWTLEASGVTTDLLAIEGGTVVGREGTMLVRTPNDDGWTRANTGVSVDLVDCEGYQVLGANGEIYNASNPLTLIDTDPGARALSNSFFDGWTTVGDDGRASSPPPDNCY